MQQILKHCAIILILASVSCIRNDIPYPIVELSILNVEGEGFTCSAEDIDVHNRTVTLRLDETTDISRVEIRSIEITEGGKSSVPLSGKFDMRSDVPIVLSLYQDYTWTLHAEQHIERIFTVERQIGPAVFDEVQHTASVNVPMDTDMDNIVIKQLKLGPEGITTMTPDPSEIRSFETFRTIDIRYHDFEERWTLFVQAVDIKVALTRADAWTRVAWLYGQGLPQTEVGFRYRMQGEEEWHEVPSERVTVSEGEFSACLSGLEPLTAYEIKAFSDDNESEITTIETQAEEPLINNGFEEWCTEEGIVYPGVSKDGAYWGSGNPGAAVASTTLTNKSTDTRPGSAGSCSALLESKLAGILGIGRLAAGNLFVGKYVATRGTNGIVGFGRPFTGRPTALHGWVKYDCGLLTDIGKSLPPGLTLNEGDPDCGIIYVALGTWTPEKYGVCEQESGDKQLGTAEVPICIDTRDGSTFFDPAGPDVIAYGELVLNQSVGQWQEFTIKLVYNRTDIVPTHLVLTCSASRYGDYYTGSRDSRMWVDDFEFLYDYTE